MTSQDRAAEVARYLVEQTKGLDVQTTLIGIAERWPGLKPDEFERAYRIAKEITLAHAAEHIAEADALDAEYDRRFASRRNEG